MLPVVSSTTLGYLIFARFWKRIRKLENHLRERSSHVDRENTFMSNSAVVSAYISLVSYKQSWYTMQPFSTISLQFQPVLKRRGENGRKRITVTFSGVRWARTVTRAYCEKGDKIMSNSFFLE